MKLRQLLLVVALAVPGTAWSAQCDGDLVKANTGLAAGPKATVTADAFERARELVSHGTTLLAAGDDIGCVFAIGQALELMDLSDSE